jgi:hypothetical protein
VSVNERVRQYLRERRERRDQRRAVQRGYDTRPVYDVPPEDDPGIGGVPARPLITSMQGFDPHGCEPLSREELKEMFHAAIARAEIDGPQLAELYDLSKTDLFSPEGGQIVREVIEARQ